MQVLLNTDPNVDGGQQMADHVESVVKDALHRFGEHVTRVEAHLADASKHARPRPGEIECTLEARLRGQEPVVVSEHADNAHQAIQGAAGKLKRALDTALGKHDPRRSAAPPDRT
jgi:ribosome-associated translation inhibitor RaiA